MHLSVSEFEPLPVLKHLQPVLWKTPYYGRGLRQFNMAPWWYKNTFAVPKDAGSKGALIFEGVDYFAKVWLNGNYLGEHEGYFGKFEFDISKFLNPEGENTIHVLVSSPWDPEPVFDKGGPLRFWGIERRLIKGTYEHDDTFVNRDVNPVGIIAPVKVCFYDNTRISKVRAQSSLVQGKGVINIETVLEGDEKIEVIWSLIDALTGEEVLRKTGREGRGCLELENPRIWQTWDQGEVNYYILRTFIKSGNETLDTFEQYIGFKSAEFTRTAAEMSYRLNRKRIFIRGCTYFPDNYVSLMSEGRYRRDLGNIKAAGFNAVRIHVHVEQDIFYNLCDEMGILVFQDTDLNWVQERGVEFTARAEKLFAELIDRHSSHPSIGSWICYNEPDGKETGYFMSEAPAPQLAAMAKKRTPFIPYIKGSWCDKDPESGDTHNYLGSLSGNTTHYLDTEKLVENFNTEFGFDAPPCIETIMRNEAILKRLNPCSADIKAIQYYQYRLLKFYIENYRTNKYNSCTGYFQFMFIDLCPQSFYGVMDYYGVEKEGLKALLESNQPLGVFLKNRGGVLELFAVNDTPCEYPSCKLEIRALDAERRLVYEASFSFDLRSDSLVRAGDVSELLKVKEEAVMVKLILKDGTGKIINSNIYDKPFDHPPHPAGHPQRMSHEIGMRLYHF
jgi:beta-mannosidase